MGDEADYLSGQFIDCLADEKNNFKDTSKPCKNGLYQCSMCKQYKPKSEFYKDSRVPCGIRHRCKKCYHKK